MTGNRRTGARFAAAGLLARPAWRRPGLTDGDFEAWITTYYQKMLL